MVQIGEIFEVIYLVLGIFVYFQPSYKQPLYDCDRFPYIMYIEYCLGNVHILRHQRWGGLVTDFGGDFYIVKI